jgi:hypothetical protein
MKLPGPDQGRIGSRLFGIDQQYSDLSGIENLPRIAPWTRPRNQEILLRRKFRTLMRISLNSTSDCG